ncbi:LysR family transcriptional regulator [Brenneria goodwinii]|uniref:LysR family transcriptional regulator n=1 Tax=Brenneria goodwinii TaxID=1109412 RepID=UPI000BAF75B7|nr:LysR family transcriptional regulator [Brenneria goodwinii]ATA23731.1 hypothetical protein AWC36_06200 [Brenneria goodwinii]MCG8154619.1 LysR family transcriptional regulator [Brenneria goodwinii]MCG8160045.1 LysR family transcriptional regulator [Brenneria goodwinii]MCG8163857.1 LysR family transcriptional regulator [Brenneria goodwinii]MCG8168466.1 LysR family transcriptional regulator [Brenneria goodwinii]
MKIERKNDINLRLLEIFGTVMRSQTTVDAAYELGISQPAVSGGIKQLEGQLGFPLFDRINRRLQPTEDAHLLYKEVEPIFMMIRSAESRIRSLRSGNAGILRILGTPPLGFSLVPHALRQLLLNRRGVKVHFDVVGLNRVLQAVELGVADVGLALGLDEHPAVNVEKIKHGNMMCLVPRGHPLYGMPTIRVEHVRQYGYIGLNIESTLGLLLAYAFRQCGVNYEPDVEVRYTNSAAMLSQAGVGMAIVDSVTALHQEWKDVAIVPFEIAVPVSICIVTRKQVSQNRLVVDFIEQVKNVIEQEIR